MSIHVLTTNLEVPEQLTQLLADGQQALHYHEDLEALITQLPALKKTDKILYDLQHEPSLIAFDPLRFGSMKTSLISFELPEAGPKKSNCPNNGKHYFVLSSGKEKTGAQPKQSLHELDTLKERDKKRGRQPSIHIKRRHKEGAATPILLSRYLTAKSVGMQRLLTQLAKLAEQPRFVFISGEEGADFELAARELNFRTNGDQSPLHVVDPKNVQIDEVKRRLCKNDLTHYCYLGLSHELSALTAERLNEYLRQLGQDALQSPAPCFILGHIEGSEDFLEAEVQAMIQAFQNVGEVVALPSLAERKDDVSLIAQSVFTTLRMAHPFLKARTLARSAIEYLEAQCKEMSYSSLVRIIRNSIALTQREILTEDELKIIGDNSPTSQRLIDGLAEQKFLKNLSGAA